MLSILTEAAVFPIERRSLSSTSSAHDSALNIVHLNCSHEAQLATLLCSLDRPSRISRFGHQANDAAVEAYARKASSTAAFIAGVLLDDELLGVVEAFDNHNGVAEIAFAVDARWRRRGIASRLLEAVIQWAERSGLSALRMVISRANLPMRGLADKAGARFEFDLDEICADIAVTSRLPMAA
jgi:RimJ/RimL family protein N-acetyltransferase